GSGPARIDDEILRAAHSTVVGGEPQDHARDVRRLEAPRQALVLVHLPFTVGRYPQLELPLRHDPAGHHAVDADALAPKLTGQAARESAYGGFGRDVGDAVGLGIHPADRAEVDDRAAAGCTHLRPHRLRRKELVTQVDLHAIFPVVDRNVLDLVAIVVGGVV